MELVSPWHNPALRALASDSVVQATRHVRALRNFASRLRSAGDSRAAGSNSGQKAERPVAPRRELPPPPPPPVKQEEDDFEEDGEFESGESEDPVAPGVAAKSDPARRPPEPTTSFGGGSPRRSRTGHEIVQETGHAERGIHPPTGRERHIEVESILNFTGLWRDRIYLSAEPPRAFWDNMNTQNFNGCQGHALMV